MIFLLTNANDNYGYICKSKDADTFTACLNELENEFQVKFENPSSKLGYFAEKRFGENIRWTVREIESDMGLCEKEDILYLIGGD